MLKEHHVGYVTNEGRGTLDIIWTCLVTTLFCTWTVQRLQVVPWSDSKTVLFRKKALWMSITLLCPEYVTWMALDQFIRAKQYRSSGPLCSAGWTLEHAFYVDMGGLTLITDEHPVFQRQGTNSTLEVGRDNQYTIRLDDLILLLDERVLQVPEIYIRDLKERSKSDRFAGAVTICQVIYFVAVSFGRIGSQLPISILEISTLAFVSCAILIELFWWHKPLDLRSSTITVVTPENKDAFSATFPKLQFHFPDQDACEMIDLKLFFQRFLGENDIRDRAIRAVWIGCIFNGIHIGAWDYPFPTQTEALLWRIATVGACASVVCMWVATYIPGKWSSMIAAVGAATFYVLCRTFIMAEVFCSFRSAPARLYETPKWQNIIGLSN